MTTNRLLLCICALSAPIWARAQTSVWQPSPGHTQVQIWPGRVPDAQPVAGPEDAISYRVPGVGLSPRSGAYPASPRPTP
jgi:hypothetical protein